MHGMALDTTGSDTHVRFGMPRRLLAHKTWLWIIFGGVTISASAFGAWEVLERHYFQEVDERTLRYLYVTHGIALACGLAAWAACIVAAHSRTGVAQARQAETQYRTLIEEARDATVVVDRQAIVQEWNAQAAQLFGFTRDEAIGRPLPTLPHGAQKDFLDLLDRLASGGEASALKYASPRLTKHGEVVDVSLSLLPLKDKRGEVTTFLETSCDIRVCAQLVRKMQQVEKMSAMGQLAAGVAHQLNTPLGSALLRAQMLEEDLQDPEQREDVQFIQRQLRYGKEIVESLLRFSRPSREVKRVERLNPVLQGVLAMMAPTARHKKVQMAHDLCATEAALVYVGRNELEQVLVNLCDNALDAMPLGGELTLRTQVLPAHAVLIQVHDTGTGMPQACLARIFEPFYTTKAPGRGTGLGLAICRRIIDEVGGTLEVSSALGQGTTFTIRLPLAGMALEAQPGASPPESASVPAPEPTVPEAAPGDASGTTVADPLPRRP
jgi:two-component system NtrC family sensor kinase